RCEGAVADLPGGRARRSIREWASHRLVGLRRRAGEDRLRACGRRGRADHDRVAPNDKSNGSRSAARRGLLPPYARREGTVSLDECVLPIEARGREVHGRPGCERDRDSQGLECVGPDEGGWRVSIHSSSRWNNERRQLDEGGVACETAAARSELTAAGA